MSMMKDALSHAGLDPETAGQAEEAPPKRHTSLKNKSGTSPRQRELEPPHTASTEAAPKGSKIDAEKSPMTLVRETLEKIGEDPAEAGKASYVPGGEAQLTTEQRLKGRSVESVPSKLQGDKINQRTSTEGRSTTRKISGSEQTLQRIISEKALTGHNDPDQFDILLILLDLR
eukprot:Gregarina_sp_Poly_1__5412@NODE_285_length_10045_cov_61_806174_g246_i0_p6_GENE_NODE_285_length_10045_cov_61_806174_g246_i0NODE_285_length_10045_cov_61_806174_g246_i0_p6_ORF_typecomplete_len173_score24_38Inj_translocase/PF16928_5/7_3Inj_translocase/PF16928_5/16Inj_translocase/PF16928_5/2_1e03_NODE_285_length_10045_cov_61_806174_g246_i021112629